MKDASAWSADEVSVRLCFLVKVRNAIGLSVAGGRRTGRIGAALLVPGPFRRRASKAFGTGTRIGCTGVAKAGDDENTGSLAALVLVGRRCAGLSILVVLHV